jgi:YVTN family beta-propeller protein
MFGVCVLLLVSSHNVLAGGSVGGRIWVDANGNGIMERGEKKLARVPVYLRDVNDRNVVRYIAVSGKQGGFKFKNVLPGQYVFQVIDPAEGYVFTSAGKHMQVHPQTGLSAPFEFTGGERIRIRAGFRMADANPRAPERIQAVQATQVECAPSVGPTALNWTGGNAKNSALPKWNVPNAVLNSVDLTLSSVFTHTVVVTNTSQITGDITVDYTDLMTVTLPNGATIVNGDNAQLLFPDLPPGGFDDQTSSTNQQQAYAYPPPLNSFIGAGTLNLPVTATSVFLAQGPGSLDITSVSIAQATLCATYEYTLLPPPSHLKNLAYDADTARLYVAARDTDSLYVFDPNTLTFQDSVAVGDAPVGVVLLNGKLYVTNYNSNTVSVVNAASLSVTKTLNLNSAGCGTQPIFVAANPTTQKLYVALHGSGRVAVLDGASDTLAKCIDGVGGGTFGIAVNATLNRVYVTNRDSFNLVVIDGASDTLVDDDDNPIQRIKYDGSPYQVAVDPNNQRVYVAVSTPDDDYENVTRLYAYDATAGSLNAVAGSPFTIKNNHDGGGIAASACSGRIYIAETANDTVRVLNSDLTLNSNSNQTDPYGLAFGDGKVFLTNRSAGAVSALDDCP